MVKLPRRSFLSAGATSAAFAMFSRRISAMAKPTRPQKLVVIFGRGGNDPLNTFIPNDPNYARYRTTAQLGGSNVEIPFSSGLALPSTSYVRAHPEMLPFVRRMVLGRGAVLGRVGNFDCKRSHFTEMRIIETGQPGALASLLEEGWGARLVGQALPSQTPLKGVTYTPAGQRLLFSRNANVQIPSLSRIYSNSGAYNYSLGSASPELAAFEGGGTEGLRGHVADILGNTNAQSTFAHGSGKSYFDSTDVLSSMPALTHNATLFPRTPGELAAAQAIGILPNAPVFGQGLRLLAQMEESMHVLRNTDAVVCGMDMGGFDTHFNQIPDQARNLAYIAQAMASADFLAQQDPDRDYLILFITEFGRTVKSNGNDGTDHGVGTAFFALGDGINTGVYNMTDPSTTPGSFGALWRTLDQSFMNPNAPTTSDYNAVLPATDFRVVFAEILKRKFNMSDAQIDTVLPVASGQSLTQLIAGANPDFDYLNFLV